MENGFGKAATAFITLVMLLGGLGLVTGGVSAQETNEEPIDDVEFPELRVREEKIEDVLGGGNFIGVNNEDNDAMIGVLYGTEENPNNIYVVSIFTRYLGTADIYDEDGNLIWENKPIPVRTLYAQRFDTIYEYNDRDENGIWDSRRINLNDDEENQTREPVYKKVPLRTAWTPSEVNKTTNDNGSVEWSLKLTAEDLRYRSPIFNIPVDRQNKLEKVELTFHLNARREDVTRNNVPVFNVDVSGGEGDWHVDESEYLETRSYNGTSVKANAKFDHLIEGWDFVGRNTEPSLLMSTEIIYMNALSPAMSEHLVDLVTNGIGNGTAEYETDEGEEIVEEEDLEEDDSEEPVISTENNEAPQLVRKNRIGFSDNWQRVGWFRWVSNVTVDGVDDEMFFQVYYGRHFQGMSVSGSLYSGMGIIGGFSYPGGSSIYHDPSISVDAFDIEDQSSKGDGEHEDPAIRIGIVMLAAGAVIIVIGIVALTGVLMVRGRSNMERPKERSDYYETYRMDR